jgi:hypothetical protein
MPETRPLLERVMERVELRPFTLEGFHDRRDRKRRTQRIAAGVVGIAVFVAAVWIVRDVTSLDRTRSVVPGGSGMTGPAETGPAEAGPAETGPPAVSVPFVPSPRPKVSAIFPRRGTVPATDYLFDLDTGQMTPLPKSIVGDDWVHDYAASPDGSRLAYVGPAETARAKSSSRTSTAPE